MFIYYKNYQTDVKTTQLKEEIVYKDGGEQYVKKTKNYSFAIKAGNNDEPHNHNDIGSFVVAKNDTQILCDLGAGLYTRQYFDNETRYSIFCNSSYGHSVPIVNGKPQAVGKQFSGKLNVINSCVTVDFADAYDDKEISNLTRTFELGENSLALKDEFDAAEICERFISTYKFNFVRNGELEVNGVKLEYDDNLWDVVLTTEHHIMHSEKEIIVYVCDFIAKCNVDNGGLFELVINID